MLHTVTYTLIDGYESELADFYGPRLTGACGIPGAAISSGDQM
jgi:hypothetical protein